MISPRLIGRRAAEEVGSRLVSTARFCFASNVLAWDSSQYLRFSSERTQPAVDLAARIDLAAPQRVIDLGCGPGNSTAVLARRWPGAALTGLDSSPAMLAAAAKAMPTVNWMTGDIATWNAGKSFDVVFSNAALQWVPDHTRLLPRLIDQVAPSGALAFQVPANLDAPAHRLMPCPLQGCRRIKYGSG